MAAPTTARGFTECLSAQDGGNELDRARAAGAGGLRWSLATIGAVLLHGLLAIPLLNAPPTELRSGLPLPDIALELVAPAAAEQATSLDLAPGPLAQEAAEAAPQDPDDAAAAVADAPERHDADLMLRDKEPPAPDQGTAVQKREPSPRPKRPPPIKKPSETRAAPRTTASVRAERRAPDVSGAHAMASAATIMSYNQLVAAHLRRFKQYPPDDRAAGHQGTARLSFTLARSGQVVASRLAGSSGYASLDNEVQAMIRRAQPFPPMPAEIAQPTISFSVPVDFSLR